MDVRQNASTLATAAAVCGLILTALIYLRVENALHTKGQTNMKHWKTTLGGILAALAPILAAIPNDNAHAAGVLLGSLGALILGATAADAKPAQ